MKTHIRRIANVAAPNLVARDSVFFLISIPSDLEFSSHSEEGNSVSGQLKAFLRAFEKALLETESSVSFREAAHFSLQARAHRRPSTVADLRSYIKRMCEDSRFAEKAMRDISISDCREMLAGQFSHSAHSYRKAQSILHSIFGIAVRQQWCDDNPAKAILRPPVVEQRINVLTMEQIRKLITQCKTNQKLSAMDAPLRLMIWCGIRPAEVRRLRWADIDVSEKVVYVDASNSKTGGARSIPLRGGALSLLKEKHEAAQLIAPTNWNRLWKLLRIEAGFISWQNDALRHTFASMHLKKFHNLYLLQEEMGHHNSVLLQTRYLNLRGLHKNTATRYFAPGLWD